MLEDETLFIEALYAAGVDNWEGFEEAWRTYDQWLKEKKEAIGESPSSV